MKTSPSGGSRHPLELYVCARRVAGLEPGLYHYAADDHCLERLARHNRPARVRRYLPGQFFYEGAAALLFFTAVFERYQWKYHSARAYRAVFIEAGHQCQTFCLLATDSWARPVLLDGPGGPRLKPTSESTESRKPPSTSRCRHAAARGRVALPSGRLHAAPGPAEPAGAGRRAGDNPAITGRKNSTSFHPHFSARAAYLINGARSAPPSARCGGAPRRVAARASASRR